MPVVIIQIMGGDVVILYLSNISPFKIIHCLNKTPEIVKQNTLGLVHLHMCI